MLDALMLFVKRFEHKDHQSPVGTQLRDVTQTSPFGFRLNSLSQLPQVPASIDDPSAISWREIR